MKMLFYNFRNKTRINKREKYHYSLTFIKSSLSENHTAAGEVMRIEIMWKLFWFMLSYFEHTPGAWVLYSLSSKDWDTVFVSMLFQNVRLLRFSFEQREDSGL